LQNDFFNKSLIKTTIIIPLSTNMLLAEAPGNIIITKKESKIDRTIMEKIENNLMFILGKNRI